MLLPQVTEDGISINQRGDVYGRNRFDFYDQEFSYSHIKSEMSVRHLGEIVNRKLASGFGV